MLNIFNATILVPHSTVLMFKVKYEIFSNSVFICCSVLSSILTVLLFSEMNLYFGLRSFKLRKYAKCKIKSCFYIHLTHFKLRCGVPYILLLPFTTQLHMVIIRDILLYLRCRAI